ncbi:MAG TPA: hypothetical protein P5055_13180, partial [Candidatus Paceibacterota bacterium]|nr:hypothetical protein [Candidatus Paceibacterota bacterium]
LILKAIIDFRSTTYRNGFEPRRSRHFSSIMPVRVCGCLLPGCHLISGTTTEQFAEQPNSEQQ